MFHHNHQAGERETARHLIGSFASIALVFCLLISLGVGSAHADALPSPGKYTGTAKQTHTRSKPDPNPTVRPLTFEVDDSGRVKNLIGEYFWYCAGYFGTEKFTDTPLPATRISSGVPFNIVWEDDATRFTFAGTVDASGTATGTVVADMGICGESRLTWSTKRGATTPPPTDPGTFKRTAPYTLPGTHTVNGRKWQTTCEKYSQTERCRTNIWAKTVVQEDGRFVMKEGWTFNNLTYLPFMTRQAWKSNPLGYAGTWTASDGRKWRTECDTKATGRNGCRSYAWTTVYTSKPRGKGGYTYGQVNTWVFNNLVLFRS